MWSIDACLYSCCFTFPLVFLFPLSLSNFSFFFLYFLLSSFLHLAFLPPPLFIVHGYPLFVPFVIVGFTPFVPQTISSFLWDLSKIARSLAGYPAITSA